MLHELGHALPALVFTKGVVSIYIGVPEQENIDPDRKLGRLHFWFAKSPLKWLGGYCVHGVTGSRWKTTVILLNGALFTFAIALAATYAVFFLDLHGFIKTLLMLLTVQAGIQIMTNLVPSRRRVLLPGGRYTYNDGEQLRRVWFPRARLDDWTLGVQAVQRDEFGAAWTYFKHLLDQGWRWDDLLRYSTFTLVKLDRHSEVWGLYETHRANYPSKASDLFTLAYVLSKLDRNEEAIEWYRNGLVLEPEHSVALSNLGYSLGFTGPAWGSDRTAKRGHQSGRGHGLRLE